MMRPMAASLASRPKPRRRGQVLSLPRAKRSLRSPAIGAARSGARFSGGLVLCGRVERFARSAGPPASGSPIHSFSFDSPWPRHQPPAAASSARSPSGSAGSHPGAP